MRVTVACPRCSKEYTLDEKFRGKQAKCICGCVFLISTEQNTGAGKNKDPWLDAFQAHTTKTPDVGKKAETNSSERPRKAEDAAGSVSVRGPALPAKPADNTVTTKSGYIPNETSLTKEILLRLAYASPALIIAAVYFYYKKGILPALYGVAIGVIIFCIIMYKGISAGMEQAARRGLTYRQYQEQWAARNKTSRRYTAARVIFYGTLVLLLVRFIIPDEWAAKIWPDLAFKEHWQIYLLIFVLNFPLLLFLASLITGDWKKYLKIFVRLFLWKFLPFHYFFKGYWGVYAEMTKEELFEWAATNMLYILVCNLECRAVKAIFFS